MVEGHSKLLKIKDILLMILLLKVQLFCVLKVVEVPFHYTKTPILWWELNFFFFVLTNAFQI